MLVNPGFAVQSRVPARSRNGLACRPVHFNQQPTTYVCAAGRPAGTAHGATRAPARQAGLLSACQAQAEQPHMCITATTPCPTSVHPLIQNQEFIRLTGVGSNSRNCQLQAALSDCSDAMQCARRQQSTTMPLPICDQLQALTIPKAPGAQHPCLTRRCCAHSPNRPSPARRNQLTAARSLEGRLPPHCPSPTHSPRHQHCCCHHHHHPLERRQALLLRRPQTSV